MRKIISLLLVLLTVLPIMASCSKGNSDKKPTSESEVKSVLDVTIPETKVTKNKDGVTRIDYIANNEAGGYITGRAAQIIVPSRSSSTVTAEPFPGYKFVQWSDGVKEASRKGDEGKEGHTTTYYAVFAPEAYEMPMIFIETETGEDVTSKEEYIGGSISVANCANGYVINDLEMEIRGRGNYSWSLEKKSYRIKLSEQQQLLGLGDGKNKNWVLLADHCDQTLMRNYISHTFAGKMSGIDFAPECKNVEVYLNGNYNGVYLLCEPITINKNRLNINEDPEAGTDIGYLVQLSEYSEEPMFRIGSKMYEIKNDLSTDPVLAEEQANYIRGYMFACMEAVTGGDRATIETYMDLDSIVDTYIVEEMLKNIDVGWDSFYFYKDAGGKLCFGPVWDFDLALGNANEGTETYGDLLAASGQMDQSNPWFVALMRHQWFREMVAERWHSDEVQEIVNNLPSLIESTAKSNYKSFNRNFEVWDIFGQTINRESWIITSLANYDEHYQYLISWTEHRIGWLNDFIGSDEYYGGSNSNGEHYVDFEASGFDEAAFECSGGSGSESDPYLISVPKDFSNLTKAVLNGQTFEGTYFKQTANLNMNTLRSYSGMGRDGTFAGVYDGCGYSIYAELTGEDQCIFPYLTGLVMNLMTDGSVNNRQQAAGICRSVRNGGAIVNCVSTMEVGSRNSLTSGISASINGDTPIIANCCFAGSYADEANEPSPFTRFPDDAGNTFFSYLYYPSSLKTDGADDRFDTEVSDETMATTLADDLNGHLSEIAEKVSKFGVTAADLCKWEASSGAPVLMVKK